ncbi:MAG: hypothetical protein JWN11_9 [Hyphomicrobiales bacterium]|nr:hypothetical protein [Hyphomicrobiales bacterium]
MDDDHPDDLKAQQAAQEFRAAVRETAYFLWKQDGSPPGRDAEYWRLAREKHLRQLAFDRWLQEGSPAGRADANWFDVSKEVDEE